MKNWALLFAAANAGLLVFHLMTGNAAGAAFATFGLVGGTYGLYAQR